LEHIEEQLSEVAELRDRTLLKSSTPLLIGLRSELLSLLENVNIIFHQATVYDPDIGVVGTDQYSCKELHDSKVKATFRLDTPRVLFPYPRSQKSRRQYARIYPHDSSSDAYLPSAVMSISGGPVIRSSAETGGHLSQGAVFLMQEVSQESRPLVDKHRPCHSPAPTSISAIFRSQGRSPPSLEQLASLGCHTLHQRSPPQHRSRNLFSSAQRGPAPGRRRLLSAACRRWLALLLPGRRGPYVPLRVQIRRQRMELESTAGMAWGNTPNGLVNSAKVGNRDKDLGSGRASEAKGGFSQFGASAWRLGVAGGGQVCTEDSGRGHSGGRECQPVEGCSLLNWTLEGADTIGDAQPDVDSCNSRERRPDYGVKFLDIEDEKNCEEAWGKLDSSCKAQSNRSGGNMQQSGKLNKSGDKEEDKVDCVVERCCMTACKDSKAVDIRQLIQQACTRDRAYNGSPQENNLEQRLGDTDRGQMGSYDDDIVCSMQDDLVASSNKELISSCNDRNPQLDSVDKSNESWVGARFDGMETLCKEAMSEQAVKSRGVEQRISSRYAGLQLNSEEPRSHPDSQGRLFCGLLEGQDDCSGKAICSDQERGNGLVGDSIRQLVSSSDDSNSELDSIDILLHADYSLKKKQLIECVSLSVGETRLSTMTSSPCNTTVNVHNGHNKVFSTGRQTDGDREKQLQSVLETGDTLNHSPEIRENCIQHCKKSAGDLHPAIEKGLCDMETDRSGQSKGTEPVTWCKQGIQSGTDKIANKEQDHDHSSDGGKVECSPDGSCIIIPEIGQCTRDLSGSGEGMENEQHISVSEMRLSDSGNDGAMNLVGSTDLEDYGDRINEMINSAIVLNCSSDVLDKDLSKRAKTWDNLQDCGDVCSSQDRKSISESQPASVAWKFDLDSVCICEEILPDSYSREERIASGYKDEDAGDEVIGPDSRTFCMQLDSSDKTTCMLASKGVREVVSNAMKPEDNSSCIQVGQVKSREACNKAGDQDSNVCDMDTKKQCTDNLRAKDREAENREAEVRDCFCLSGNEDSVCLEDCYSHVYFHVGCSARDMGPIQLERWGGGKEMDLANKDIDFQQYCRSGVEDMELNHYACLEDTESDGQHRPGPREQQFYSGYTGCVTGTSLTSLDESAAMPTAAPSISLRILPRPSALVASDTERTPRTVSIGYCYTHLITPRTQQEISRATSLAQTSEGTVEFHTVPSDATGPGTACAALGMSGLLKERAMSLRTSHCSPLLASALPRAGPAAVSSPSPSSSSLDPPDTDGTTSDIGSSRDCQEEGGPRHWLLGSGGNTAAGGAASVQQSPAARELGDGRSPLNTFSRSFWEGMAAAIEITPSAAATRTKHKRTKRL
jgi:hypothetical protein